MIAVIGALVLAAVVPSNGRLERLALVVGQNHGASSRAPLRYAETDARRIADVLGELGDVAPERQILLVGASRGELDGAWMRVRTRVAELRASGARVSLLFYYSGHSDGQALEFGDERVAFSEVRKQMAATGADVRLAIVDSCRSGGLLATKGGTPGPAFDIQLANELDSTGEAIITSSAADEAALESLELRASFFSHHLLSGLRGAADASGDGVVTLSEAYEYAFARTVRATSGTSIGTQHPAYDYRLSGQGELVLTRLDRPTATLELPAGFARVLIVHAGRDEVLAELGPQTARRIAVVPGEFAVYGKRADRLYVARLSIARGERRVLADGEFHPAPTVVAIYRKGDAADDRLREQAGPRAHALLGAGIAAPIAQTAPLARGAWLSWVGAGRFPFGVELGVATLEGGPPTFRETQATARLGWRARARLGALLLSVGAEAGGGAVWQAVDRASTKVSWLATWGAGVGAQVSIIDDLLLEAWLGPAQALVRRDDAASVLFLPRAYVGIGWQL